jgi:hypothetical protein
VWHLGGDEAAGAWGLSVSLDDNPDLAGRYVYFAVWAKVSAVDTGLVLETSQLGPNTTAYAADTDWHVVSYVDRMPAAGTVTFSVAKISAGDATSTVSVACPVLAEVGRPFVDFG